MDRRRHPIVSVAAFPCAHGLIPTITEPGTPDDLRRLEELLDLVDGFETPYNLELLATVHYAAQQDPSTVQVGGTVPSGGGVEPAQGRLFTDRHVQMAAQRLRARGCCRNQRWRSGENGGEPLVTQTVSEQDAGWRSRCNQRLAMTLEILAGRDVPIPASDGRRLRLRTVCPESLAPRSPAAGHPVTIVSNP